MVGLTPSAGSWRWTGASAILLLWIAALVFASVCGGLALADVLGRVSALWLANAIIVFALLKHPRAAWPAVLVAGLGANFCASLVMGDDFTTAAALTLCNALGIVIVATPLEYQGLHDDLSRPKPLCVFYALALGPAPALAGLLSAVYFHWRDGRDFFHQAFDWYATDALGYSIVVPLLMTVKLDALRRMFSRGQIAMTLLLLAVVAAALLLDFISRDHLMAFLVFPAIILFTFQRGFAGGFIGLLMVATYFMVPVLARAPDGMLAAFSPHGQIVLVQVFIAVIGFTVVLVGAALAEQQRLEQGLAIAIVRAEAAREEALVARDAAERANRLKSMFLATMSHELRTPLNAIIGFSELMNRQLFGPLGDERYREYSGLIQGAGHHLLSLINDVLDMSKIEAGKFEMQRQPFDIRELAGDCAALMGERARRNNVALQENFPSAALVVEADRRAVKQILINLLSNAIKFTPSGGAVTVRARAENAALVLSVEDTGIGIPIDQVQHLGNPFVQARSSAGTAHEGTGLGLALVRALADVHGGRLRIESTLNQGTTVTVTIPCLASAESDAAPLLARSA
jgi:signal transduction histidine kinase